MSISDILFLIAGIVIISTGIIWGLIAKPWLTPEQILQRFYSNSGVAEDMLMDPLILGGKKIVPLIIREVQRPDMPRRRYAINFLGNGGYAEAVPSLEKILQDETELDYVRGDALEAMYQIDVTLGTANASLYSFREDHLGKRAQLILSRDPIIDRRRSYYDAFMGRHD